MQIAGPVDGGGVGETLLFAQPMLNNIKPHHALKMVAEIRIAGPLESTQCPNKFVCVNIPSSSKYCIASSTVLNHLVLVSVMNGLGFFSGCQTT